MNRLEQDASKARSLPLHTNTTGEVFIEKMDYGYSIKYDGLRKSNKWTLIDPNGKRINDYDSLKVTIAVLTCFTIDNEASGCQ